MVVMKIDGTNPVPFLCFRICRKIRKLDWKQDMVFSVCVLWDTVFKWDTLILSYNKTSNQPVRWLVS